MLVRVIGIVVMWATLSAIDGSAAAQAHVDFARDVQPILKQYCYECHDATQHRGGFRLDRRRDALRGGTQSNMGPGNAEGTRLYQMLVGTSAGPRMPLGKDPLPPEKIAIIKAWIDQGIDWPDAYSGEKPARPIEPAAAAIVDRLRAGDFSGALLALKRRPNLVNRVGGPGGASVLMFAALYGDIPTLTLMLDAGGDPNLADDAGATPLMWAANSRDKTAVLLRYGADPNARSDDGNTALLVAVFRAGNARVAKLLVDDGAKLPLSAQGFAGLRSLCPECVGGLPSHAPSAPPAPAEGSAERPAVTAAATPARNVDAVLNAGPPNREDIRSAVTRVLPRLVSSDRTFMARTGCVSCHNNSLTAMTLAIAREAGYTVDSQAIGDHNARVAKFLDDWREDALQILAMGGGQDAVSYVLTGLNAGGHPGDLTTDAMVRYLLDAQQPDGPFRKVGIGRVPIEGSLFTVTALSVRSILAYAPPAWRPDVRRAVKRATSWLASAKPQDTEDRTFQVLGLRWAGSSGPALDAAARALLAEQRSDGGWAQLPSMESDAYATGEALTALCESGVLPADAPPLLRGLRFLLSTQAPDGSWFVKSRVPFRVQVPMDSEFPPYGQHAWISIAATNWATSALILGGR